MNIKLVDGLDEFYLCVYELKGLTKYFMGCFVSYRLNQIVSSVIRGNNSFQCKF